MYAVWVSWCVCCVGELMCMLCGCVLMCSVVLAVGMG